MTADPLFVGATRPPMRWGVTYSALLFNMVFTLEVFLLTKNLLTGTAVIMLTAANAASAADISAPPAPVPAAFVAPPFSWTGFYVGANLGGGWASSTLSDGFIGAHGVSFLTVV